VEYRVPFDVCDLNYSHEKPDKKEGQKDFVHLVLVKSGWRHDLEYVHVVDLVLLEVLDADACSEEAENEHEEAPVYRQPLCHYYPVVYSLNSCMIKEYY
jgi:hypothetical protein